MKLLRALILPCLAVPGLAALVGCAHPLTPDNPRLTPHVRLINDTFHSRALARFMHLRIIVPANPPPNRRLPVVYLLHGAGANYQDWSNRSDVAAFAAQNVVLVMPDAAGSYYINDATMPNHRYEDYMVGEVIPEVHRIVPYASTDRALNAIVGISRGGFGAAVLALKHPQLFSFLDDLSGALDFPERPFRPHAPLDSLSVRKTFGPAGSATRLADDPFLLLPHVTAASAPYIYIGCGNQDLLYATNRRFANLVAAQHLPSETHFIPGIHDWFLWDSQLPMLEAALLRHFHQPAIAASGSQPGERQS